MTTDHPTEETARAVSPPPLFPATSVLLNDHWQYDPAEGVAFSLDNDGAPVAVTVEDTLVLNPDGEILGVYDPAMHASAEEPEQADLAPAWAERMVARLGRYTIRRRLLDEEGARIGEALNARLRQLAENDEEYRDLAFRRDHVQRLHARTSGALDFLARAYVPTLQDLAEWTLKGSKRRTLDLLNGALSLRKVGAKVALDKGADVEEDEVAESLLSLGEQGAVSLSVRISGLSPELRARILSGEATVSGLVAHPETQRLQIRAGGSDVL